MQVQYTLSNKSGNVLVLYKVSVNAYDDAFIKHEIKTTYSNKLLNLIHLLMKR